MNLKDTTPNYIYLAIMTKPFFFGNFKNIWTFAQTPDPVEILFRTVSNENSSVTYEILAASKNVPFASISSFNHPVDEIPITQLPLFVHFPYKTPNFENLLKGEPLNSDGSFHSTIRFRPATNETTLSTGPIECLQP
jgi:hypothetical protein